MILTPGKSDFNWVIIWSTGHSSAEHLLSTIAVNLTLELSQVAVFAVVEVVELVVHSFAHPFLKYKS